MIMPCIFGNIWLLAAYVYAWEPYKCMETTVVIIGIDLTYSAQRFTDGPG